MLGLHVVLRYLLEAEQLLIYAKDLLYLWCIFSATCITHALALASILVLTCVTSFGIKHNFLRRT